MASKTSGTEPLNPRPYGDTHGLDTDVLHAICGSIDGIHDLLSMSLTCSMMWRIAMRQLFMTHIIRLASCKAIQRFRLFIINHETTCAHHIRSLVIPEIVWIVPEITMTLPNHVGQLMDILDCAVNLRRLDLCLDPVHAEPARISSAFARLSALWHLSLVDPGLDWAPHALSALPSSLRTLCVGGGDRFARLPPPPGGHFLQLISRFSTSSTLTVLLLDRIPMHEDSVIGLPRFPSVRSLTIAQPLEREPRLYPLLHLFPSLDGTLRLRLYFSTRVRLFNNSDRRIGIREENRRAQEASRWTSLDRLDCDSGIADMLALQCAVNHFTIDSFDLKAIVGIKPKHLVVASLKLHFYLSPTWRHPRTPVPGPYPTHIVLITSRPSADYPSVGRLYERKSVDYNWDASFVSHPSTGHRVVSNADLCTPCCPRHFASSEAPDPDTLAFQECHTRAACIPLP